MKHLKYLKYVLRHKWYVFVECCKMGIPWRGITHDFSKFRPSEWRPYADFFYGPKRLSVQDTHGALRNWGSGRFQEDRAEGFDFAWLLHQKRNDHHWQWWILPEDDGGMKVLPMSWKAVREMVCDWEGAGHAQGHPGDLKTWYGKNGSKMQLHPDTRAFVEERILGNG